MSLKIIYEDDTLAVFEKPPGIAVLQESSHDKNTVADALKTQSPFRELGEEFRYGIVHRLDKDTSGILLTAKTKEAFLFFQRQFQAHTVKKEYICLASGTIKQDKGMIETFLVRSPADRRKQKALRPALSDSAATTPLQEQTHGYKRKARLHQVSARRAITKYEIMERLPEFTLVKARPETGRKHQLRAHFAYLGHPLAGDKLYAFKNQQIPEGLTRQFLHASFLAITLPNGARKEFHSPLADDLQQVLQTLRTT